MSTEPEEAAPPEVIEEVVAPPEVEPVVEETTEEADKSSEETDLRDEKGRFKGVQARIDELTRARREAERERDFYKGLATPPAQSTSPADAPKKPTPDQFDNYGDYVEALAKHTVAEERQKIAAEQFGTIRQASWASKVEAAKSTHADYDTVVGSSELQLAKHVADALMDADRGPELAYHMARNPDLAERLNSMSPTKAAIELGRLESSLTAPVVKAAPQAPAPISPIRSGPSSKVDLGKADMDTYIAERRKQGARY